jgi:hypothetical protein
MNFRKTKVKIEEDAIKEMTEKKKQAGIYEK